jgi:signal transduction histidine kinase
MKYIEELARGLREISKGNLNYRVAARSRDELGSLATSINLMTAELQLTLEEERRAEQTKTELITNVSHDLRTPLTLIMGYLRLLKDKNYESEAQADTYLNIAYSKSEKLKSLIDDLFEYTKLSSKGDTLKLDAVYMNELLEQLLEEMVSYAEDNELNLVRAFPPEKLKVNVDADKMIRVFDNLLTNAVKYSRKPGTVKVLLFREADHVLVRISNNGTPLPQEDLDRLFDRFYRVDASRSSETGGSGLGLAIAKSIIDYHGGDIWAESEGDEIRFWVKLKLAG